MRPTANGAPFLGCRAWMWVVYGKWVVRGRRLILRKKMSVGGYGGFLVAMRCFAVG